MLPFIAAVAVAGFMVIAVIWDLRSRRIPNWMTVPFFIAGLIFHTLTSGWAGFGFAAGGFATGFGILFVLWLIGGGGGGDVKLMGAVGAWLGAPMTLIVFIASSLLALLVAIVAIVWRLVNPSPALAGGPPANSSARSAMSAGRAVPYAVPVALAIWLLACARSIVWFAGG
jgi:prepilin peptidase CpaA